MTKKSAHKKYTCLVLAAGRGKNDPMAQAFKAAHKCLLLICGVPMICRVLESLKNTGSVGKTLISIESDTVLANNNAVKKYLGKTGAAIIQSKDRASTSLLAAITELDFPILVTTADHALLTPKIVEDFLTSAEKLDCDLAAGLVHESSIAEAYPDTKRTYLRFSDGGYSGANLFALMNEDSLKVIHFWKNVERERKKPWKLIRAFGLKPLFKWLFGMLSLEAAFKEASLILSANVKPVILSDPHASIDVDKQSDHDLVEKILAKR